MILIDTRCSWICISVILWLIACAEDASQKEALDSGIDANETDLDSIHFRSATELTRMIREGEITSVELLERFLERIERYNGEINAVVAMDIEAARSRAQEADDAVARGEIWGPLHGLPITIKDSFEVIGMPATAGDPELEDYVPERNALAVQRLIDAGAIVFGKTNLPYPGEDWQTCNDIYGTTNNPWDLSRTPGGSSGGSAAALSAGLTALELGSDLGGSIRVPSHFTGVYGHKTTFGIVSRLGSLPGLPTSFPAELEKMVPFLVLGPMARSADDLDLALEVLTTPGDSGEVNIQPELLPPRRRNFEDYRVAVWLTDPSNFAAIDDEVMAVLRNMVDKLREAGVTVDEEAHPDIVREQDLHAHAAIIVSMRVRSLPPNEALLAMQQEHRDKWVAFFKEYDLLLAPVSPTTAFPHSPKGVKADKYVRINDRAFSYLNNMGWATLAIVAGLPATAAPIGLAKSGLPVGVQIIGAPYEDRTTIDFARGLSEITGAFTPPPDYDDDQGTVGRNADSVRPDESRPTDGLRFEGWVMKGLKGSISYDFDPLAGVQVCVHDHPEIPCATTDDDGYYSLRGLPKNSELIITLVAEGYVKTAHAITTEEDDMAMFPLPPNLSHANGLALAGYADKALAIINQSDDIPDYEHFIEKMEQTASDLEIEIDRNLGAIWFRANVAVGISNAALSDVAVSIEPAEGDGPFYRGDHSEGYFYNLSAAEYLLRFSHPDYDCNTVWPLRGYPAEQENTIRVPVLEGFQTDPVGVVCEARGASETNGEASGVTISGTVVQFSAGVGSSGSEEPTEETPIEEVEVCIFENDEIPCVYTGSDGKFELEGLPQDAAVLVSYTKEGYPSYLRPANPVIGYIQMSRLRNNEQIQVDEERIGVTVSENNKGRIIFAANTYNTDNVESPYAFNISSYSYMSLEGVTVGLNPAEGSGPFYADDQEQLDPSRDETSEAGWGTFVNLDPDEYDLTFTHPAMECINLGPDFTSTVRVVAGFITHYVGGLCF